LQLGLVFPQTEFPSDPAAIRDYAQTAEALGFTHIVAYDHVLGANPERPGGWSGTYTYRNPFQEPLVLFSYMAGLTQRIGFATGIVILPQRQSALFAKQAATLDVLSGGRLRVGVGLGWNQVEYTALNENFRNRGRRIEEQVEVLRQLWTKPLVTFEGRWHTIPDAGLNPLPVQRPIPLWFGGHADAPLRRAARLGDGWMSSGRSLAEVEGAIAKLRLYRQEAGLSWDSFGVEGRMAYGDGDADQWAQTLAAWEEMGATHVSFNTMGHGFDTAQKHLAAVRLFAEAVETGK
jgi:probable F420-dependent oxidoreductase